MNNLDFDTQFLKYKELIIDEIVSEFGRNYEDIIKKRIGDYKFFFDSTPEENNRYMQRSDSYLTPDNKLLTKLRYLQFLTVKKDASNRAKKYLKEFIMDFFPNIPAKKLNGIDSNILIKLFCDDNFNESLIDSLSTESTKLLKDNDTPTTIKDSIKEDRQLLTSVFDSLDIKIDINDESIQTNVDKFISERKKCREIYLYYILTSDISYVKKMSNLLGTKEYQSLYYLSYYKYTHNGRIKIDNEIVKYIFYPIIRERNAGLKSIDVNLIHEMLHCIQGKYIGDIINEVNVELWAIKITNSLHDKGIFIFDNPKDYVVTGETLYEQLFPLAKSFIEKHDIVFKAALIYSDYAKLTNFFGNNWLEYTKELTSIYEKLYHYAEYNNNHEFAYQLNSTHINYLINEMEIYYQSLIESRGKRHV